MVHYDSCYLCHYGLKGMKWGTRRWQFQDGRFNEDGKARYFGQNSSHRPDSVRMLQGDPPKRESKGSSFDKEKAKKIAKNIAIGTAIVGGTVLVAYGGYKIHQAGGFSNVSKSLKAKMQETKLEDLKIKTDKKKSLAQIKENTKNEFKRLYEDSKLQGRILKLDPEGKIDSNIIKELAGPKRDQKLIREKLKQLDDDEIFALNSGRVKLSDLQGRNKRLSGISETNPKTIMDASRNSEAFSKEYDKWLSDFVKGKADRNDRPIPDVSYLKGTIRPRSSNPVRKMADTLRTKTPSQIISEYKKKHPGTKLSKAQIIKNYVGDVDKKNGPSKKLNQSYLIYRRCLKV